MNLSTHRTECILFVCLYFIVACSLSLGESVLEELKISSSGTEVKPGEILKFEVNMIPGTTNPETIEWYVNDELQTVGRELLFLTENTEKRYIVYAQCKSGDTIFTSNDVVCYGSENPKLLKVVYEYTDKYNYKPAISVSVSSSDVSFNYAGGYASVSSGLANTISTPHILYSITKSFTAVSILKLRNEGLLSFYDRLDKYVTGLDDIYINNNATIMELLTHRSGISDYTSNPMLFISNPFQGEDWDPLNLMDYIEHPATERGTFIYSSTNYVILGMIVEKVTGVKLSQYISENFLIPHGLTELKLAPQDSVSYQLLAHPHAYPGTFMGIEGDGINPIDIEDIIPNATKLSAKCSWSAGGMVGTASLVSDWGYNLLSSAGNVDSDIRNEILNSLSEFTESDPPSIAYGIATRKLYHNGKEFIGSYGRSIGDENLMFYNADKDVCIAILTSSDMKKDNTPNIDELMYAIYDVL